MLCSRHRSLGERPVLSAGRGLLPRGLGAVPPGPRRRSRWLVALIIAGRGRPVARLAGAAAAGARHRRQGGDLSAAVAGARARGSSSTPCSRIIGAARGRSQIAEFGGDKRFTPAFVPSDQCARNCSFPAGDPAVGFYFVAAGLPGRRAAAAARRHGRRAGAGRASSASCGSRRAAISCRTSSPRAFWSAAIELGRCIAGSSCSDGLACARGADLRDPPPALRRFAAARARHGGCRLPCAYRFLDRPLAAHFTAAIRRVERDLPLHHQVRRLDRLSRRRGGARARLAIWRRARARDPALGRRLERGAWRAGFVFAGGRPAPASIGDILKPVFGRARPKLWFSDGIFGFTWHGAHARSIGRFPPATPLPSSRWRWRSRCIYPRGVLAALCRGGAAGGGKPHHHRRALSERRASAAPYLGIAVAWALWAGAASAPACRRRGSAIAFEAVEQTDGIGARLAAAQAG